jgi:hypothetical protein
MSIIIIFKDPIKPKTQKIIKLIKTLKPKNQYIIGEMKKMGEKNEFEEIEEDFPQAEAQEVPDAEDMFAKGSGGVVYDWQNAPDRVKAPERIDLDGKIVTITNADIIIPDKTTPWDKTRDKKKDVKFCQFKLAYSEGGQVEFYSGVRVFKVMEGNIEKYSQPSFTRDGVNQASQLLGKYAKFKKKEITEVTIKEFLAYLHSNPKVSLKAMEFKNPKDGKVVKKNMVEEFLP